MRLFPFDTRGEKTLSEGTLSLLSRTKDSTHYEVPSKRGGLQKKTNLPIAAVRAFLEISAVSIGWYLGGTVGLGTLLFAFGIGPAVALALYLVGKIFS